MAAGRVWIGRPGLDVPRSCHSSPSLRFGAWTLAWVRSWPPALITFCPCLRTPWVRACLAPLGSALSSGASGSHKSQGTEILCLRAGGNLQLPTFPNRSRRKALQTLAMCSEGRTTPAAGAAEGPGVRSAQPHAGARLSLAPGQKPGQRPSSAEHQKALGEHLVHPPTFLHETGLRGAWGCLRTRVGSEPCSPPPGPAAFSITIAHQRAADGPAEGPADGPADDGPATMPGCKSGPPKRQTPMGRSYLRLRVAVTQHLAPPIVFP